MPLSHFPSLGTYSHDVRKLHKIFFRKAEVVTLVSQLDDMQVLGNGEERRRRLSSGFQLGRAFRKTEDD